MNPIWKHYISPTVNRPWISLLPLERVEHRVSHDCCQMPLQACKQPLASVSHKMATLEHKAFGVYLFETPCIWNGWQSSILLKKLVTVVNKLEGNSCCKNRLICFLLSLSKEKKKKSTSDTWIVPQLLMLFLASSNLYNSITVGLNM